MLYDNLGAADLGWARSSADRMDDTLPSFFCLFEYLR